MSIASRTPEGFPIRCKVCGAESVVDPSLPPGDAVCPRCGVLAWNPKAMTWLSSFCEQRGLAPETLRLGMQLNKDLQLTSMDCVELVLELVEYEVLLTEEDAPDEIGSLTLGDVLKLFENE